MEEYDPRRYAADPALSPGGGFFDLSGPVGPDGLNTRQDVSQIETLLGNSGSFDLGRTDGPTGWYGSRLDEGIRAYQGRRGLAVDGLILPDGETLASLKSDLGQTFAPFSPPSIREVDQHHDDLAQGGPGLIAFAPPPLAFAPRNDLPQTDAEVHAANMRAVEALLNYTHPGDHPLYTAKAIEADGDQGVAEARDLVAKLAERDPSMADKYARGVADRLPEDLQESFLGRPRDEDPPMGVRRADVAERYADAEGAYAGLANEARQTDLDMKQAEEVASSEADQPETAPEAKADEPDQERESSTREGEGDGSERDDGEGDRSGETGDESRYTRMAEGPATTATDAQTGSGAKEEKPAKSGAYVAKEFETFKKENLGKLAPSNDKNERECVALVKKAIPEIGFTKDWKEGAKIKGPGDPPLQPGTAIAIFKDGQYDTHTRLVAYGWKKDDKGRDFLDIFDQWAERDETAERKKRDPQAPSVRSLYFSGKGDKSDLGRYSVIRRGP